MSIATLFSASMIVSCQKDNSVAPAEPTPASATIQNQNVSQPLAATTYKASGAITAKSNTTYSGLVIDLGNGSSNGFTLSNVTNVHITNCKIINTKNFAMLINNSSNITIDNCLIKNVGFGIYVQGSSKTIKVNNNQIQNINGVNTSTLGHAIQFNGVSGGGNQINNNRVENIAGQALHPHDQINVYKSNGLPGDSIQVIGNWVRGGQTSLWPTSGSGAAGIVVGDVGGSYQVCRNNIVVNGGRVGIQAQGGTHIKVDHNQVYGAKLPITQVGLAWGNWSGTSTSDVTYAYNKVKWYNSAGSEVDHYENNSNGSVKLVSNTWGASISASILPATIITMQ
jgi:parallel beta-helix repeat protein